MTDLWQNLKKTKKPIVLYGMGNGADRIIEVLQSFDIDISGVFVSDGFVRDKTFHGHKLCTYADMQSRFGEMVVLVAFGSSLPSVIANISRISKEQELYAPYIPVIDGELFTCKYVQAHQNELEAVYNMLYDDKSKQTFDSIIKYRLSGKIDTLLQVNADRNELYNIISPTENEIYLDLGAYNGDTVTEFVNHCPKYGKIYALEPDAKSFAKLKRTTEHLSNTECINAAIHSENTRLQFAMRGGRNSSLSAHGKFIDAVCIDGIRCAPTFIKMDVEGAEEAALHGAKQTISSCKPRLAISCYHKTDDLFAIPLQVQAMRSDYKIYMRKLPYIPDWDSMFIFV